LVSKFGRGFADKNLRRMMRFAEAFPDEEIVATIELVAHIRAVAPVAAPSAEFYAEMCRIEGWSVRTLRERVVATNSYRRIIPPSYLGIEFSEPYVCFPCGYRTSARRNCVRRRRHEISGLAAVLGKLRWPEE
jgi:hypothetical protein